MAAHVNKTGLRLISDATCGTCAASRPVDRIMVTPKGPVCDSCSIGLDADRNARLAAREDFGAGPRFALAAMATVAVAMLLSGPFPSVAEPLVAVPMTGLAAGCAAFALVWGGWAVQTGGHGRLVPGSAWPTAVRASGGVAVVSGVVAGGLALALAALPYVLVILRAR